MPTMTRAGYTPPKPEPPKKQPVPPKKKKRKKKRRALGAAAVASLVIFALAALAGAGVLYVYAQTQPYAQTFAPGVILMGYPLAGATREDAQKLMDAISAEHVDPWRFEIVCGEQTYTLTAQDVGLSIDPEATLALLWPAGHEGGMLSRYMQLRRVQRDGLVLPYPVLTYDLAAANALLERIRAEVECDPVDATVTFVPGSATPFRFTQEREGYALDLGDVVSAVEADLMKLRPGSVTLEPQVLEPRTYSAVLENSVSLRSRVTAALEQDEAMLGNVQIAAALLNGLSVGAGETLSFNAVVGKRTQEGGYAVADEPAYGPNVSGVGGGICQVSTALYRAALLGGIEVAQRSAAVRPVDYCGMGQEAVVSDQGLDLMLRNQTDAPLFVMTRVYTLEDVSYLELSLFGEPLAARYALRSLTRETGTIEEPIYVRDREGLYATYTDERVPVTQAQPGYAATVERVTLDDDGLETACETVSEDAYAALAPAVYVGVNEREP